MKRVYRRLLFFLSTVAFLTAAPLVILYAIGYRTSLNADPLPVGVVLLESTPRRAEVVADGQRVGTTPRSITGLPAGEVELEVSLAGYQPWRKRIFVEPGRATEARDIRLFPENPEVTSLLNDVASFSLSPNRQLAAIADSDRRISVIDLDGGQVGQVLRLQHRLLNMLWSPTSASVLIEDSSGTFYMLAVGSSALPQVVPQLAGSIEVGWDPRIPGRVLHLTSTGKLSALNVDSGVEVPVADDVSSFAVSSRNVFVVEQNGGVAVYTLQGALTNGAYRVPEGVVRTLLVTPGGDVAYRMLDGSLWVELSDAGLVQVSAGVLKAGWSPDGRMLYVQPDANSLHVYNVSDERTMSVPLRQLTLVTRLSREIIDPQWFAGGRYLLYQVADEVLITEIDTRDYAQTYQVDTTNTGKALPAVGELGETLLYLKQNGAATDLVEAELLVGSSN